MAYLTEKLHNEVNLDDVLPGLMNVVKWIK